MEETPKGSRSGRGAADDDDDVVMDEGVEDGRSCGFKQPPERANGAEKNFLVPPRHRSDDEKLRPYSTIPYQPRRSIVINRARLDILGVNDEGW